MGNTINISGVNPTAYNLQGVIITAVPTTSSFTIASTLTTAYVGNGLAISLTPTSAWYNLSYSVDSYLADKILVGTDVTVLPPTYVPIYLSATITAQSSFRNADIKLAVYQAMLGAGGLFQYENNSFARTINISEVTSAIQNVEGVVSVALTQLSKDGAATVNTLTLAANEIPYLLASNLVSTVTGGV